MDAMMYSSCSSTSAVGLNIDNNSNNDSNNDRSSIDNDNDNSNSNNINKSNSDSTGRNHSDVMPIIEEALARGGNTLFYMLIHLCIRIVSNIQYACICMQPLQYMQNGKNLQYAQMQSK